MHLRTAARALLTLLLCGTLSAAAQRGEQEPDSPAERDPYIQGDDEFMERAGYVRYGPFDWADDHRTNTIDRVLGNIGVLWLETEHFRIGCGLKAYKVPNTNKEERKKLREELRALHEVLPEVDPRTRVLDRWLRLHLYAMRLEKLYDDFSELMEVDDESFPSADGELVDGRPMGRGPYLGQPSKFTVLIFDKCSDLARYGSRFLRQPEEAPKRHNFIETGTLLFGTCTELAENSYKNDTALHCHLVFNITHNLVAGFKYYGHELPHWWAEGLAHWFSRRVSKKHNNYSAASAEDIDVRLVFDWAPRVRARVGHDYFPTLAEMRRWKLTDRRSFADHMMLWSRVDHLISLGEGRAARFQDLLNAPIEGVVGFPTEEQLQQSRDHAFETAWEMTPEKLDALWAEYVEENYPRK